MNSTDQPESRAAVTTADPKVAANLCARAALAGFELVDLPDGTFLVSRWDQSREFATVADVEAFLRRVGAPA
jgi:hypothetical protein